MTTRRRHTTVEALLATLSQFEFTTAEALRIGKQGLSCLKTSVITQLGTQTPHLKSK